MLKHKQPNPLNVFGLRRVEVRPAHFTFINFDIRVPAKKISDWIFENLEGRFYFGDEYAVSEINTVVVQKTVGFERSAEASYFAFFLNQLNDIDQ